MTAESPCRFISPSPPPTEREREVAEVIAEEAAEVIQRATKLLRFGVHEVQPGQPYDNAWRLGLEIGDLVEIVELAVAEGLVQRDAIAAGRSRKRRQLATFLQTDPEAKRC